MLAAVRDRYGPPDVVELREVPKPEPGDGDVLVRVHASSLNAADLDYLYGRPRVVRVGLGMRAPRNPRMGLDVAGVVEAVGVAVTRLKPGNEVFADMTEYGSGAFAEYVSAPAKAFAPKPARLSMHETATIPQAAILALQGLQAGRRIRPGDRVLINGASGNVGPFAVQIAKAAGAEVTGVCSTEKIDFVRSIGADHVIDYTREDFTRNGQRYDRILDVAAHRSVFDYRRALAPGGRFVWIGGSIGGLLVITIVGGLLALGDDRRLGLMWWKPFKLDDVATLTEMIQAGKLTPVIDRTFPLAEIREALRYLDEGRPRGKVVIDCLAA